MMNNWQEQAKQMVEQGKQAAANLVSGGEMVIEVDLERGFFRVKLRNIQPPQARPQLTEGFCQVLKSGAAMFNLQVTKYTEKTGEKNNE